MQTLNMIILLGEYGAAFKVRISFSLFIQHTHKLVWVHLGDVAIL
jgi:hypothetical protein